MFVEKCFHAYYLMVFFILIGSTSSEGPKVLLFFLFFQNIACISGWRCSHKLGWMSKISALWNIGEPVFYTFPKKLFPHCVKRFFEIFLHLCPIGWGCRIHRLLLWIFRSITWWSDSSKAEVLGNVVHPFTANAPSFTLSRSGSTW